MKTNLIKVTLFAFAMTAFLSACNQKSSFTGDGGTNAQSDSINKLNFLSNSHTEDYSVHYDYVSSAGNLGLRLGACAYQNCESSRDIPYISGQGNLVGRAIDNPITVVGLFMGVTFETTLAASQDGQACLATAISAYVNHRQLDIAGNATVVNYDSSGTSEAQSGVVSAGGLASTQSLAGNIASGNAEPAIFHSSSAIIVFSGITFCKEGDPSNFKLPQPTNPGPPTL